MMKLDVNGSITLVDYYSQEPSFTLKIDRSFRQCGGEKNTFFVTSNIPNLFNVYGQYVENQ